MIKTICLWCVIARSIVSRITFRGPLLCYGHRMITENSSRVGIVATLRRSALAWRPHWRVGGVILLALFVQQLFLTYFAYSLKTIVNIAQGDPARPRLG